MIFDNIYAKSPFSHIIQSCLVGRLIIIKVNGQQYIKKKYIYIPMRGKNKFDLAVELTKSCSSFILFYFYYYF
jgi:predicted secreted Zn-dependent protease